MKGDEYSTTKRTLFVDHAQNATIKMVVLGLANPSVSLPRNGEGTRPGSLALVIHDETIGACAGGPMRRGMTLLTTNEIPGLVVFWA